MRVLVWPRGIDKGKQRNKGVGSRIGERSKKGRSTMIDANHLLLLTGHAKTVSSWFNVKSA
jgi:hypothetical protein